MSAERTVAADAPAIMTNNTTAMAPPDKAKSLGRKIRSRVIVSDTIVML